MSAASGITFQMAAEREPFLAVTEFDWAFDEWYSAIVAETADLATSSWAGPVAQLHWQLSEVDPAYPGTSGLEVQFLLGDTTGEGTAPLSHATYAEHAAAAAVFNSVAASILDAAKAEVPGFTDQTYRHTELRSNAVLGTNGYLNIILDEPASMTDTERDAFNSLLSAFSRRHLFRTVESLLRAGVFVRRGPVRGQFESSGVGPLTSDLLPR